MDVYLIESLVPDKYAPISSEVHRNLTVSDELRADITANNVRTLHLVGGNETNLFFVNLSQKNLGNKDALEMR